jgi:hypothetical protein
MNVPGYLVLGVFSAAVIVVVVRIIRRKKQGKGCGCCPQRESCADESKPLL